MVSTVIKKSPKALGTVQIMIGGVIFFFGIVLKNAVNGVTVDSRVTYWGSFCFIGSGALSIISVDLYNPSVVKAALVMDVMSVVAAVVAVIVFSIDLAPTSLRATFCRPCFYELSMYYCQLHLKEILGTIRVLLVFILLEVFVSIMMFVLTWKTRNSPETMSLTNSRPINSPPEENPNSP
ncbi:hypothetical protein PHYPO_G00109900 [Pangasianodon hypophthalmus]|uniref:MARVEL domain-containing protein n=1 Tax=Pangasianodon hypophthalmus TaxID=310915 RepID=A0A5N5Q046_PANHP|nr:membrane-spanning 4-domains subfamily A member 15 isoform X1 [Pangasianodon hypophthalmus]XP_034166596.1 membrane-spanning 4-domains subfamily A member 15 isoform X1 [Pangasianodon hypophthalmus]KAB5584646.1 hypothetical protein PHYPO_G00109900 [Pangasianodon hypophthalmus]